MDALIDAPAVSALLDSLTLFVGRMSDTCVGEVFRHCFMVCEYALMNTVCCSQSRRAADPFVTAAVAVRWDAVAEPQEFNEYVATMVSDSR